MSGKQIAHTSPNYIVELRLPKRLASLTTVFGWLTGNRVRWLAAAGIVVFIFSEISPLWQQQIAADQYRITHSASQLLPDTNPLLANKVSFDAKNQRYNFNSNYNLSSDTSLSQGGSKITAVVPVDASKGVTVTDPVNNVSLTLAPQFKVLPAKQQQNRLYYPLSDGTGWLVYSLQANQVREDLVLDHANGGTMTAAYQLQLGNSLQARLMSDGSVGIYGSSLPINSNVSTGSSQDAALLQKIRQHAAKDKLLFVLPRPVIHQTKANTPDVSAHYSLHGDTLTVAIQGLKKGHYPIDIDPSVYVQSAQGLMYGNNETNVNFDTTNNLFEKTPVSGGNIRDGQTQTSWTATGSTALPTGLWNMGVAVSGGYIYVVGGVTTTTTPVATVYWAPLNASSSSLIGSWTTNTAYNLPVALKSLSLVAYNDYLFAVGGNSGSATVSTVYKLHLAASGEPTPTWVSVNGLPAGAGLQYNGAVAYQNELYVVGGQTTAGGTTGVTASYAAAINPDGSLGSWAATGVSLPAALWGMSLQTYNGYLYAIGGSVGTTMQTAIYYAKITTAGSLNSWQTNTYSFSTGRQASGGNFATIWAGYLYISGGCNAVNASGYCSAVPQGDIQEASINADGSIGTWTTLKYYTGSAFASISQPLMGYGLVAFNTVNNPSTADNAGGTLYAIGGCATATAAGSCASPRTANTTAAISTEGDVGPSIQNTNSLPTTANTAGEYASGVAVNNGYIYDVGGCSYSTGTNDCTTAVNKVYYAQVNADGSVGTWAATSNNMPGTLAAMGVAVFNNVLYTFGGTNGNTATTSTYYATLGSNGNTTGAFATKTLTLNAAALYPYTFAYTNPVNLANGYIYTVGGCTQTSATGIGCNGYVGTVWRCTVAGAGPSSCASTNQLQLPVATGIAAGAVYGNYVYLSGGANSNTTGTAGTFGGQTDLTYYAQIDASGNLVLPPNKTGTSWPQTTGILAANAVDSVGGMRRRAAAYAVNGYLYVIGGHDATVGGTNGTTLQDVEIGKINPTTGDIASFVDDYYQITARWDFKGVAANGYLYLVGGCSAGYPPANCTAEDGAVQYLQVYNNSSGSPAAYTAGTNEVAPRIGASSAIYNGYIYVAGGQTTYGATPVNTIEYAPINADGSVGSWTTTDNATHGGSMTTARMGFKLLAINGYLYAIGGQSTTAVSSALASTESASIGTGGVPGTFAANTALQNNSAGADTVYYNGYFYVSGGQGTGGVNRNSVQYASVNTSTSVIGTWNTTGSAFTQPRINLSSVAYNGTLYIIGGFGGGSYLNDVQYAQINSDGTVGSFSFSAALPQPVSQATAYASNGYLYVIGGTSAGTATTCTNNTYIAPFSANSAVASGNVPNGLGNWYQTGVTFSGTRYGATASYANGKAYLFGGSQCASNAVVTAATSSYYATLQSQPQVAQYSYPIDALSDVFPSKTLYNGIDNGIGASWVLDYKSSTETNDTWGQDVVYGKMTLGSPQAYTPKDGSGTNTNYARYYWLETTIDGSQAFGYPEDVSRGPTISNFILQFTANPSKRLRNGKTFINNVQQPLDAPF